MSTGRWHYSITLPGGMLVTADYREPVTIVIHRVTSAWSDGHDAEPSDLTAINDWAEANRHQIQACQAGECDHVVV